MTDLESSRKPSTVRLTLALGLILVIWSYNYIVAKVGFRELPPLALASFRIVVAGLSMVPVYVFGLLSARRRNSGAARGDAGTTNASLSWPPLRDLWTFAYLGFFGMVVNHIGFTVGLNYTSVSHAAVIVGATPIVVLALAWIAGLEGITTRKLVGLGLAFAGAIVLGSENGWGGGGTGIFGDLLILGGVIGFSLYTVLGKRVATGHSALRMTVHTSFCAALLILPVAIWQAMKIEYSVGLGSVSWEGWAAVIYMGTLASAASFLLYFWALQSMSASKLASLNYLQPVGATILAALLIGEKLTYNLISGGVLISLGVYAIESHSAGNQKTKV